MSTSEIQIIRGDLLKKGHTFSSIAVELGCSRSHVHYVVSGRTVSAKVRAAIKAKLGRDPWTNKSQAAGTAA